MDCSGSITLDASASTSFDGNPLFYVWGFTDVNSGAVNALPASSQPTINLVMAAQSWMQAGATYDLVLTVTDSQGGFQTGLLAP